MNYDAFNHLMSGIQATMTTIGLLGGGWWAYEKFVRRDEHFPRVQFSVDIGFVGIQADRWLVEVIASLENKGVVPVRICEFAFDLRYMVPEDPVKDGPEEINGQVCIPHKARAGSWLPPKWRTTFIHPGVVTRYSYIADLPSAASYALVHGRFNYERPGAFHTADRLVQVPPAPVGQ